LGNRRRKTEQIHDADPLEDIRNTRKIWKVIKGGEIVGRVEILEWAKEIQVKTNW
jgi:hypothetical protein